MTTTASDDLIARVRAYLAGLEPPVPADELSDEEVAGLVMASLVFMEGYGEVHYSLPERFRLPPRLPASPPFHVEVDREDLTARVSADTRYTQFLEFGTARRPRRVPVSRLQVEDVARVWRDVVQELTGLLRRDLPRDRIESGTGTPAGILRDGRRVGRGNVSVGSGDRGDGRPSPLDEHPVAGRDRQDSPVQVDQVGVGRSGCGPEWGQGAELAAPLFPPRMRPAAHGGSMAMTLAVLLRQAGRGRVGMVAVPEPAGKAGHQAIVISLVYRAGDRAMNAHRACFLQIHGLVTPPGTPQIPRLAWIASASAACTSAQRSTRRPGGR
jgi:hypothetical protein